MNIRKFVRPNVYSLTAYSAKDIPCKVKLDANESPYGFTDVFKTVKSLKTNRYPDPEARGLRELIARELRVKPENILQGNGSDVPTFSMYGIISQALGEKRIAISLNEEFDLDSQNILLKIRREKPRLIFLSTPNNPTGNCFSSEKILKIIEASSSTSLVVVDEAYQAFASERGFIPFLNDYENLIIMRTLSKIGLAGLRVGFLIAREEIINEVNKVRLPFNLNSFSQAIAAEVIKKKTLLKGHIKSIISERGKLFKELSKINGIRPYPSEANFILFRVNNPDAVYNNLLRRGVLVRNMKGIIDGCLRVTVGTPQENRLFLKALKDS
jgi:histidinol-phosphate aminotransferase